MLGSDRIRSDTSAVHTLNEAMFKCRVVYMHASIPDGGPSAQQAAYRPTCVLAAVALQVVQEVVDHRGGDAASSKAALLQCQAGGGPIELVPPQHSAFLRQEPRGSQEGRARPSGGFEPIMRVPTAAAASAAGGLQQTVRAHCICVQDAYVCVGVWRKAGRDSTIRAAEHDLVTRLVTQIVTAHM